MELLGNKTYMCILIDCIFVGWFGRFQVSSAGLAGLVGYAILLASSTRFAGSTVDTVLQFAVGVRVGFRVIVGLGLYVLCTAITYSVRKEKIDR